jgi:hypothetical protein
MPTEFEENDLIDLLEDPGELEKELIFLGYFLQFKRPKVLVRSSSRKPLHYSTPYVRFELDLGAKSDDRLSQHEVLICLSRFFHAHVSYVCPMLFDQLDVFSEPDIQDLRFVSVSSAPVFKRGEHHCITFQNDRDYQPYWMSEPKSSDAFGVDDWAREHVVTGAENVLNKLMDLKELHDSRDEFAKILAAEPGTDYVESLEVKHFRYVPSIDAKRERHPRPSKLREWEKKDGMHDAPLNIIVMKREKE